MSGEPLTDWMTFLERSWADRDLCLPGGESARACQERVLAALTALAASTEEGGVLVISSHGNALSLFLNHLDSDFGYEEWRAMRNPDLFEVHYAAGRFTRAL